MAGAFGIPLGNIGAMSGADMSPLMELIRMRQQAMQADEQARMRRQAELEAQQAEAAARSQQANQFAQSQQQRESEFSRTLGAQQEGQRSGLALRERELAAELRDREAANARAVENLQLQREREAREAKESEELGGIRRKKIEMDEAEVAKKAKAEAINQRAMQLVDEEIRRSAPGGWESLSPETKMSYLEDRIPKDDPDRAAILAAARSAIYARDAEAEELRGKEQNQQFRQKQLESVDEGRKAAATAKKVNNIRQMMDLEQDRLDAIEDRLAALGNAMPPEARAAMEAKAIEINKRLDDLQKKWEAALEE